MARKQLLWLGLAGIAVFVAVVMAIELRPKRPKYVPPIDVASANEILDRTVRMVHEGRIDQICEEIPDYPGMCRWLLDGAKQSDWWPNTERPRVVRVSGADTERVMLHLEGTRRDGTSYDADFEVTWGPIKDKLVGSSPIYWSGVRMGEGGPRTTCTAQPCPPVAVHPPTS